VRRPSVVVADDHPGILYAATSILARAFEVAAAVDGGAPAIDAAAHFHPDAVVLDIDMPDVDGFEAAAAIKATRSDACIVFLSSHDDDDFVLAGMNNGASAFVSKSRMERDLVPAVFHALVGRSFVPSAGVLPRWQRPIGDQHDLQLYATDDSLVEAAVAHFASALAAGDSIIAIASEPHRHALHARLKARRIDPAALVDSGRYTVGDAASALEDLLLNGAPDAARFAAALDPLFERALAASSVARPHVTMFGEIAPILCRRGEFDGMIQLERIADEYAASRPLSILCGYSTECVAEQSVLASVCAEHSTIVPASLAL
jgi:DNA-binding NarL/FixJ family response regulator